MVGGGNPMHNHEMKYVVCSGWWNDFDISATLKGGDYDHLSCCECVR